MLHNATQFFITDNKTPTDESVQPEVIFCQVPLHQRVFALLDKGPAADVINVPRYNHILHFHIKASSVVDYNVSVKTRLCRRSKSNK